MVFKQIVAGTIAVLIVSVGMALLVTGVNRPLDPLSLVAILAAVLGAGIWTAIRTGRRPPGRGRDL